MSIEFWILTLEHLPCVVAERKQFHLSRQRLLTPTETAALASQTRQIMTQICVVGLDGIGLALALRHSVLPWPVVERTVSLVPIAEILVPIAEIVTRLQNSGLIRHGLQGVRIACQAHRPGQQAAGLPIYGGDNVSHVFLCVIKVKSSSISMTAACAGAGRGGRVWHAVLTQVMTVCGATPKRRAVRRKLLPSR